MALSAAELDALITDLTGEYRQLSREYSETADEERKEDIAERMGTIDYQLAGWKNNGKYSATVALGQWERIDFYPLG